MISIPQSCVIVDPVIALSRPWGSVGKWRSPPPGLPIREEDPREALLKYAKEAEENPQWIAHVYQKTQPKPVFDYTEDEMEKLRSAKRKK